MSLASVTHTPNPGSEIVLIRFDARKVGGLIYYWTMGAIGNTPISFGGQVYTPIDIVLTGFEVNSGGQLPTPSVQISNSDDIIQGVLNAFGDLCGCEFRRIRTFDTFLDSGATPDGTAFTGPDIFRIERKANENADFIEWELSASLDQEGKMLPGNQVIRDSCRMRYRRYDPTNPAAALDGFYYPFINPCPYTGSNCFTANGDVATASGDVCGRKLSDCKLRFGSANSLPFDGFPGAARVQM